MFESSIQKYFSSLSPNKVGEEPVKDNEIVEKSQETQKSSPRQKRTKLIKNSNESINFSGVGSFNNINVNELSPVEQEAYTIIQELNAQLLKCQEELEKKNEEIEAKDLELQNLQSHKIHIENLSRQIHILQDKLKIYDAESGLQSTKLKAVRRKR